MRPSFCNLTTPWTISFLLPNRARFYLGSLHAFVLQVVHNDQPGVKVRLLITSRLIVPISELAWPENCLIYSTIRKASIFRSFPSSE